ncbi:hypothetical protein H0H93_001682 [Arthromyces matolae]|nr:hypothetical protein H0H93_001682 [Arthromyces matolae]
MSFFIRMAQTRTGAERLLEAQILAVLEQCDFLDARPEADQSFMDRDSFLPSAIQRHHQLLTPALQLIDVMLATLSNKHGTLVHQVLQDHIRSPTSLTDRHFIQALQFLTSHSATFTILLKDDSDCVPLAFLEEIHLLVTLSANVLPIVPKSALLSSNSGFGAVHAAILALAARSLGNRTWFASVLPQTDVEAQWVKEPAFGYGSQTKFEVRAWRREQILRKSIIVYLGCASDFTENEITLVLSPITTAQMRREDQTISQYLATIPTVGDAISAVNSLSIELSRILKQIADFGAEVASRDQIAVDKITDIVPDIHISLLQELDVVQKRQLISEEFANVRRLAIRDARVLLDTTEMLLLLLWRHIQHYASATAALPAPSASLSLSSLYNSSKPQNPMNATMRLLSSPDPETFKEDVIRRLGPVLMKLEGLDLKTASCHLKTLLNKLIHCVCRALRFTVKAKRTLK